MSYFAKPIHSKNEIKVELDLSSYSKKSDLKKGNRCRNIKFCEKD